MKFVERPTLQEAKEAGSRARPLLKGVKARELLQAARAHLRSFLFLR
jgi:hypothetical protein